MHWYAIHTKPRKENDVARRLTSVSIETLNPRVRSLISKTTPLFPNYIFARWDLERVENYHMIKYTRGVHRVLGTRDRPVPISDDVINVIRVRLDSTQTLEQQTFGVGTRVKVKRGILRDLIGVLEKPVSAQGRVAVLLSIYEREMKAMLHVKDITLAA